VGYGTCGEFSCQDRFKLWYYLCRLLRNKAFVVGDKGGLGAVSNRPDAGPVFAHG
jgi:hypothetical protein